MQEVVAMEVTQSVSTNSVTPRVSQKKLANNTLLRTPQASHVAQFKTVKTVHHPVIGQIQSKL